MDEWGSAASQRVVLGRKDDTGWVGFHWTGEEPEGMNDPAVALALGAQWDGDELVVYNMEALEHDFSHLDQGWMEDSD
ncbi:MAG: hypothetical protein WD602_09810 [Actinomycetota bacterium]